MKNIIEYIMESTETVFRKGNTVSGKLPTGKTITGKFIELYNNDKYAIVKDENGKEYSVLASTLEKPSRKRQNNSSTIDYRKEQEYRKLLKQRREIEMEMEDELGSIGDDKYDGNNRIVVKYSKMLDNIDKKIEKLSK